MNKVVMGFVLMVCLLISKPAIGWSSSDLETKLEKWMTINYPVDQGRWEVWLIEANASSLGLDLDSWSIKLAKNTSKPKKIMSFKLINKSDQVIIKARVACFKKVMVSKKTIQKQRILTGQDWQWEERLSTSIPFDAITRESDLANCRTKKVLTRREIITRHSIENQPVIVTGKRLTLKVQADGVVIKTDATSLEEGHLGDWIRLKQCDNGVIVKAQVINPDLTQIVLNRRQ